MPYKLVLISEYPKLYKVKKDQQGPPVYFSKNGLPYNKAIKQLKALYANEIIMQKHKQRLKNITAKKQINY